jgi:hypothetical protein
LSHAELINLTHRIVERFRFLQQMRARARMIKFRIGGPSLFSRWVTTLG